MNKTLLSIIAILLCGITYAQQQLWNAVTNEDVALLQKNPRDSNPKSFLLYHLDLEALKVQLADAPLRSSFQISSVIVPMPDAQGNILHFRVYKAPVMHKELAAKYPGITSYIGQCIERPSSMLRFSITLFGLHAMALTTSQGTWYIDPYTKDAQNYIIYKHADLQTNNVFSCLTSGNDNTDRRVSGNILQELAPLDNGNFRTYRLAIATTVEYSAFQIEQAGLQNGTRDEKMAAVLSAITVTMTRVNSMFERDLSVSLELIPNNDLIVFIEEDELNNEDAGELLEGGNEIIYATIGAENFDIGHSFGTGGGGLAAGAPCSDFKAGAMTGLGSPVGDGFDINYVAHEMGHQFGAGHTFNIECGGNRADDLAYEPGSGTTIMAYAGVCYPNIQYFSDAQFHAISIQQMRSRINGESNCVPLIPTGNIPPVANAGRDYVIPKGTAFILEGLGTDGNNDVLTYNWEQMNKEISEQPPVPTALGGPNFRSLPISESPNRFMPRIEDVLNNNLFPTWEVIPTVGRVLDFALTVRDNNINGGESATDYMHIDVAAGAGPFTVTSPNTAVTWQAGSNHTVTWNVAGTTENGVNTPYVEILLSTDGGFTYPEVIALGVPNDGSEIILVPNLPGQGRIMVRGHNNIFYDISNSNFTITPAGATFLAMVEGNQIPEVCKGATASYTLNYEAINGFTGATQLSLTEFPANATVTISPTVISANGQFIVTVSTTNASPPGLYDMILTMTSGTQVKTLTLHLNILSTDFSQLQLIAPANNADTLPAEVMFDWSNDVIASSYHLQVAADADFTNVVTDVITNVSEYSATLTESTHYFWRVLSANAGCEGQYGPAREFTTGDKFCNTYTSPNIPLAISSGDPSTASTTVNVDADFTLEDISVNLDINHSWIGDVVATLISPAGTPVVLFSRECSGDDNASATFNDNGGILTCLGGSTSISGTLSPLESLSILAGESAGGTWTLQIDDEEGGDGGEVTAWNLELCGLERAVMNVPKTNAINFTVYPNPNRGSFNVQYNGSKENNTAISVYDMQGRMVYSTNAAPSGGLIIQPINLNVQAGVYVVNIIQGANKSTKKMVVE
jgi:subtilisin-like proprotein convertase family protein